MPAPEDTHGGPAASADQNSLDVRAVGIAARFGSIISKMGRLLLMTVCCCCFDAAAPLLNAQTFLISDYKLIFSRRVSVTEVQVSYSASITNTGVGRSLVFAKLTPPAAGAGYTILPGFDTLAFPPVGPGERSTTTSTFTIVVDRRVPFDFLKLLWTYRAFESTPQSVSVGKDLEVISSMTLAAAAPHGGVTVTITSNDPSKVLLSTEQALMGTQSITLTVPAGLSATPGFYIQGRASSGTVTIAGSAPGFAPGFSLGVITVTLTPSGIVLGSAAGLGINFQTSLQAGPYQINVLSARLDPVFHAYFETQLIRGGASATVNVTSSNPAVGAIVPATVTIPGGDFNASTTFTPLVMMGATTLLVDVPAGFTLPSNDTTPTAFVIAP